jgi:hypothetical protein
MNKRPLSITLIAWLFILTGGIGSFSLLLSAVTGTAAQSGSEANSQYGYEFVCILVIRLLALIGGLFLLRARNWARWLLIVWLGYHVVLSAMHSAVQTLVHGLLMVVILYFLFCPKASAYFRGGIAKPPTVGE